LTYRHKKRILNILELTKKKEIIEGRRKDA
jgi:hypothetical protein